MIATSELDAMQSIAIIILGLTCCLHIVFTADRSDCPKCGRRRYWTRRHECLDKVIGLTKIDCPYCEYVAMVDPEMATSEEVKHMTYKHPTIIHERQRKAGLVPPDPGFGPGERGIG